MLLSSSSCKVIRVSFNSTADAGKGLHYLKQISRVCLEPGAAYSLLQRSSGAFSDLMFEQLLTLGRRVNEYTSALEVLDHLEIDLQLDEFRGEI